VEEEIDLRPYIEAIVQRWYWIVGAALLAGIVAFIATSFTPPTYQATTLIGVIAPREVVQLDERIRETTVVQPLRAFPQLALSDQVLQMLLTQMPVAGIDTVEDLRQNLEAEAGDDTSIIQLKATSQDPAEAAAIVNTWAEVFIVWANEVYVGQGNQQVAFFEEQLAVAETELKNAEEALVAFQAINRTQILSNTLAAYTYTQSEYLTTQRHNAQLTQQVQELREQLASSGNLQEVTLADQLTALSLQLQVFGVETTVPLQLQVLDGTTLTTANRTEQLAQLDSLLATLAAQAENIEAELISLEPRILELQEQQQQVNTEYNQLLRQQFVFEDAYMALAHEVEESRITSQDTTTGVRLASNATIPQTPTEQGRLIILGISLFAGAILAIFVIVVMYWWNKEMKAS
jgi:uncharacterized protein involved in exopolysaccharide biosynthesis